MLTAEPRVEPFERTLCVSRTQDVFSAVYIWGKKQNAATY